MLLLLLSTRLIIFIPFPKYFTNSNPINPKKQTTQSLYYLLWAGRKPSAAVLHHLW